MKYQPHDYQKYATQFIIDHPTAVVFLDMGLGKTSITLTAIQKLMLECFEVRKTLIIAPLRVAYSTWPAEIQKWDHLQGLTYSVAVGTAEERRAAMKQQADIYIINRENVQWLVEYSGIPFDFDMVVIDELSSFKNHQSKRFRSLLKVRHRVKRIVGLTGTPSSNGLMDLWAEFRVLDMGQRLGRFITQYRNEYFRPDRYNGQVVYSYSPLPGAEDAIYEKIGDITISMRASDHLSMPELASSAYTVHMSDKEKAHYDRLKHDLVLTVDEHEITAANAASLSNKLCQMANGAIYDDDSRAIQIHNQKLDALEDIIEAANGRPVLVAYWFKHDLERIRKRLDALKIEYARISDPGSIDIWNRGGYAVGLIHPASAGHGLNLQAGGNHLVWFGLTWSLELYQQTNARLYRQGQTAGTVVIQHIVTEGTMDEQILHALERKEATQAALMEAVKAELGGSANEREGE